MLADVAIGDETGFAVRLAGQAPEHRPIIDVQHPFDVVFLGVVQRLDARLVNAVGGEMGAGDQQALLAAMKVSLMSSARSAMSAQFSR